MPCWAKVLWLETGFTRHNLWGHWRNVMKFVDHYRPSETGEEKMLFWYLICSSSSLQFYSYILLLMPCRWLRVNHLNLSLPWYHLRTTNKSAKCEPLSPFVFFSFFRISTDVRGLLSKCTILKLDLLQNQKYILLAGVLVHFLARKFYRLGQWRG